MNLFRGLRPLQRATALRDALAGVVLAAMDIPQVLGYSKIAGMPVITGLYSLLLPLVAFAAFGSSRYLILQLYFTQFLENGRRPGPKGHVNSPSFRGLKPPAPSGIFDLQL